MEIDEEVSTVTLVPNPRVVPDLNLTAWEGEESAKTALGEIEALIGSHADCQAEEARETDGFSFVDIMGSLERDKGSEIEGLTFADILQRADFL